MPFPKEFQEERWFWIRFAQLTVYLKEFKALASDDELYKNTNFFHYNTSNHLSIYRLSRRLELLGYDQYWKYPIILAPNHKVTQKNIVCAHLKIEV